MCERRLYAPYYLGMATTRITVGAISISRSALRNILIIESRGASSHLRVENADIPDLISAVLQLDEAKGREDESTPRQVDGRDTDPDTGG